MAGNLEAIGREKGTAGLSAHEAAERLSRDGPNVLPQEKRRGPFQIAVDAIREPMLQLLIVAAVLYLFLGDRAEALILIALAATNVALVAVQEGRTEKALAALQDLAAPQTWVTRDGQRQRIDARELVVGDLIAIAEGDRAPADGVLIEASNLEMDESLLTGESVPVHKVVGEAVLVDVRPGGEGGEHVWSGSMAVRGAGSARVIATGARTEIGRIGRSLSEVESAPSPLHLQTRRLVRLFAVAGIGVAAVLSISYACCTVIGSRRRWPESLWPWRLYRRSFHLS